jgi:hypothetical protein
MNKFRFERSTDKREKILQIFVGLKEKAETEIIQSAPTKESHPQYDFAFGPFKTREDSQKYVKAMGELACGEG